MSEKQSHISLACDQRVRRKCDIKECRRHPLLSSGFFRWGYLWPPAEYGDDIGLAHLWVGVKRSIMRQYNARREHQDCRKIKKVGSLKLCASKASGGCNGGQSTWVLGRLMNWKVRRRQRRAKSGLEIMSRKGMRDSRWHCGRLNNADPSWR